MAHKLTSTDWSMFRVCLSVVKYDLFKAWAVEVCRASGWEKVVCRLFGLISYSFYLSLLLSSTSKKKHRSAYKTTKTCLLLSHTSIGRPSPPNQLLPVVAGTTPPQPSAAVLAHARPRQHAPFRRTTSSSARSPPEKVPLVAEL